MLLLLATLAMAEDLWVILPVDAVRWPDGAAVAVKLGTGDQVEVLLRDGDRVRVRKGTDFGWVAASALSVTPIDKPIDLSLPGAPDVPTLPDGMHITPSAPVAPVAPTAPVAPVAPK